MRLIDAERFDIVKLKGNKDYAAGAEYILGMIHAAPTIEAEQVRRGEWVPISYDGYADGFPVYDEWECSECRFECKGEGEPPFDYCPYCGAKMDGGEEK